MLAYLKTNFEENVDVYPTIFVVHYNNVISGEESLKKDPTSLSFAVICKFES